MSTKLVEVLDDGWELWTSVGDQCWEPVFYHHRPSGVSQWCNPAEAGGKPVATTAAPSASTENPWYYLEDDVDPSYVDVVCRPTGRCGVPKPSNRWQNREADRWQNREAGKRNGWRTYRGPPSHFMADGSRKDHVPCLLDEAVKHLLNGNRRSALALRR